MTDTTALRNEFGSGNFSQGHLAAGVMLCPRSRALSQRALILSCRAVPAVGPAFARVRLVEGAGQEFVSHPLDFASTLVASTAFAQTPRRLIRGLLAWRIHSWFAN